MSKQLTKIEAIKKLEANGLSFTANVIMNGCGKPTTKLRVICELLSRGFDVRTAQFETTYIVVGMTQMSLSVLDGGVDAVKAEIIKSNPGNDWVKQWVTAS